MHNRSTLMAALAAMAVALAQPGTEGAAVGELQQQLQQARAAETAAKAKVQEAKKASAALNAEHQKVENLRKEVNASLVKKTDGLNPDQVKAHVAQTAQLQSQLATAEKELKQKSLPAKRALTDAQWAAAQATGATKKVEGELAKAQSQPAAAASSKPAEKTASVATASPATASAATTSAPSKSPAPSGEITVPDISAFTGLAEMQAVARHAGLVPVLVPTKETPPPGSTRLLKKQNPEAGAKAKKGDPLQIIVFQKPAETVDVPNLTGLTLEQAQGRLKGNMTITSDEVGDKPPTPEQAYRIFEQNPAPNTMIAADKTIVVAVKRYGSAKADEPVAEETPTPTTITGTTPTDAESALFGGGKSKNAATATKTKSGSPAPKKKRALTPEEKRAKAREWFRSQGHN